MEEAEEEGWPLRGADEAWPVGSGEEGCITGGGGVGESAKEANATEGLLMKEDGKEDIVDLVAVERGAEADGDGRPLGGPEPDGA